MQTIKVGTRASRLALAQTHLVLSALKKNNPQISFEIVTVKTKGDEDNRPLFTIDRKGIFEKEVNQAVNDGKVDFAVHSLKDVPSDLDSELVVASIPKRARPNDVLVNSKKLKLAELDKGSIIGTSSLRRAIQIMRKRPDLVVKPIRGNVETRVKKSIDGSFDAIVLAEAGLTRLGMVDMITQRFSINEFTPAPGQGAIAIVCRSNDTPLVKLLQSIEDKKSRIEVQAERALIERIESGCRFPVGAIAVSDISRKKLTIHASVFSSDGTQSIKLRSTGSISYPEKLGRKVGGVLLKKGATEYADEWRMAVEKWNQMA